MISLKDLNIRRNRLEVLPDGKCCRTQSSLILSVIQPEGRIFWFLGSGNSGLFEAWGLKNALFNSPTCIYHMHVDQSNGFWVAVDYCACRSNLL